MNRRNTNGKHETAALAGVVTARAEVERIKASIEAGEQVSGADLMAARAELEAAEMRVPAARERDAQEQRTQNAGHLAAIGEEIAEHEQPDWGALVRELHTAARALAQTVNDHNGRVTGWARSIRALEATETTYVASGGAVVHDGYVQAPASISALLGRVFDHTPERGGLSVTADTPEHVEQAVTAACDARLDKALDPVSGRGRADGRPEWQRRNLADSTGGEARSAVVVPLTQFDQDAMQAAFLRYKRDDGQPYAANTPDQPYPDWIDRADLIEHVPDYETGQVMDTNRKKGMGFTANPSAVRLVGVSGVESTAPVPSGISPGGVVRRGGAVIGDDPVSA